MGRALFSPSGVHYAALALAAILLLAAVPRAWLFYDDWSFVVPSLQNIWAPHVGHWSTAPFLLFLGLRDVFGLNSYLPFAIPVIVAQLALAHLIWRFLRRVDVTPWVATVLSLLLMFFGVGSENVLWAFQVGFVGAMVLAMAVLMILLKDRLRPVDVALVVVLSTVALSCSGSSIPLLVVAALIGWSRHGFWRTAALLAIPAVAYLVWFALIGRTAAPAGRAEGLTQTLYGIPTFAISMLADGLGRAVPIAVLGTLAFASVAIWGVLSYGRASRASRPAYILFLAAPIFAILTGYSRVGLGLSTATSSRYLFFVIPVMLPLMALALDAAIRRANLPLGGVIVLLLVIVVYNAGGLLGSLVTRDARSESSRERLSATAALESQYPGADPNVRPGGQWAPDVLLSDLEKFQANHWFTPGRYGEAAELSARTSLGVEAAAAVEPASSAGCSLLPSDGSPVTFVADRALVRAGTATTISVSLADGAVTGDSRSVVLAPGWAVVRLVGAAPSGVALRVASDVPGVTVCGE